MRIPSIPSIFRKSQPKKPNPTDPAARKAAAERETDQAVLLQLAKTDELIEVKRTAINKLQDLIVLDQLIRQLSDEELIKVATERFKQLLKGQANTVAIPLTERLQWLELFKKEEEIVSALACSGAEEELRLAALALLQRDKVLADIAIKDSSEQVRLAAAAKITKEAQLKRVLEETRTKDKQISRFVRDRLEQLNAEQEKPIRIRTEAESICKTAEALGASAIAKGITWEQQQLQLGQLRNRWQLIAADVDAELTQRYQTALAAFQQAWEQEQQRLLSPVAPAVSMEEAEDGRLCEQLEILVCQLQVPSLLNAEDLTQLQQQFSDLQQQWAALAATTELSNTKRFQRLIHQCQQYLTQQEQLKQVLPQLTRLCEELEHVGITSSVNPKTFTKRWSELTTSVDVQSPVLKGIHDRFAHLIDSLQTRMADHNAQFDEQVKQLRDCLQQLETTLEAGELHVATSLEQKARDLLTALEKAGYPKAKALEARLTKSASQIKELRGWEHWGTKVERERLCEEMEELVNTADEDPEETARLIRDAQNRWKKLGAAGHSQSLWERFNKACNQAYKPCQSYFEEQAKKRQENLQEKEDLCTRLEGFVAAIDWTKPQWKEINSKLREIEHAWHSTGPTDRKTRKPLKKRFETLLETLEPHLEAERKHNLQLRQRLIEQAQAALQLDSIKTAIEQVKEYQKQWHVTVPSNRRQERQLWKEFRGACDAVFDRRKQQDVERDRQQATLIEAKTALCEQIEALLSLEGDELKQVLSPLKKLQQSWSESGHSAKKNDAAYTAVEKRFRTAVEQVERRYRVTLMSVAHQQSDLLRQKAQFCVELEHMNIEQRANAVDEIRTRWEALPPLQDKNLEKGVTHRFENAADLSKPIIFSAEGLKNRELLCIRLEILADIDSPAEAKEARMAYRAAKLAEAMTSGGVDKKDKATEAQQIEHDWYLGSPVKADVWERLEKRFQHALEALKRHKNG